MKKFKYLALTSLLSLGLASCTPNSTSSSPITDNSGSTDSGTGSGSGSGSQSGSSSTSTNTSTETFDIKTSDNGLSTTNSSFLFSTNKEGDNFPPEASVIFTADNTWAMCTALDKDQTKITVSDSNVLPEHSYQLVTVTKADLLGSQGSNEIAQIKIKFLREHLKPGTSKIKVQLYPSNGSTSINKLTTLCVEVNVKEFGTIDVPHYKGITMQLNFDGLEGHIKKQNMVVNDIKLVLNDTAPLTETYGSNFDYQRNDNIEERNDFTQNYYMRDMKLAIGHTYQARLFVEGVTNDDKQTAVRMIFEVEHDSSVAANGYEFSKDDNGHTIFKVTGGDNTQIQAKIGSPTVSK